MSGSTTSLPEVFSYIAEAIQSGTKSNPHRSEVEPASYAWFDSYGIDTGETRQELTSSNFGLLVALGFPDTNASRYRTILDLSLWWICFQGMAAGGGLNNPEEMKGSMDAILRAVNDPNAPSSNLPLAAMVQSCFQRMVQDASPLVIQRFVAGLDDYLQACYQQKFNRPSIPTLDECIELRRGTLGTDFWAATFQYADGLDLPDQVVNHQTLSEFSNAAADLSNMLEDIYSSIRPGGGQGTYSINIVSAVMHHNRLDCNDAIKLLDPLIRRRMEEYQDLKAKLPSFGPGLDDQVAKYVQSADRNIVAMVEWASSSTGKSPRYTILILAVLMIVAVYFGS
ncbi:isoprenoid synthase domain-containing protein [Rhizoctonia solani]|nr:isoprenoid synthase domain-containing protein [Rhizoctonia solani]